MDFAKGQKKSNWKQKKGIRKKIIVSRKQARNTAAGQSLAKQSNAATLAQENSGNPFSRDPTKTSTQTIQGNSIQNNRREGDKDVKIGSLAESLISLIPRLGERALSPLSESQTKSAFFSAAVS